MDEAAEVLAQGLVQKGWRAHDAIRAAEEQCAVADQMACDIKRIQPRAPACACGAALPPRTSARTCGASRCRKRHWRKTLPLTKRRRLTRPAFAQTIRVRLREGPVLAVEVEALARQLNFDRDKIKDVVALLKSSGDLCVLPTAAAGLVVYASPQHAVANGASKEVELTVGRSKGVLRIHLR
ncbi:MAG: hypothetical protein KIT84_11025 [Labilithrix sp.]|nr:hypothetical protein [Labilithrix sp.]MCW5811540.1 hypothetical protein [Labilithrix sp.]